VKAEKTRQYILERVAPVFNRKGYDGTSFADLEAATGLTKGALYGHFSDKESLAEEVFLHTTTVIKEQLRVLLQPIPTFKGKLIALFDFFAAYVLHPPVEGGCPLLNTAVEADDHRTAMKPLVSSEIRKVVSFISLLIKKGVKAGEFRGDVDARALSYTFFCCIEGAIMFSRVEGSREPMNIVVNHCKSKLDQITCNKKG